jgi:hypothetical protein
VTTSLARRAASAGLAAGLTVLLTAGPALADNNPIGPQDGADPGNGISVAHTLLLYVLVPGGVFAVIALLSWLSLAARGTRYRPAKGWGAAPVWFAGPTDPAAAVAGAEVGSVVRGGGSGSW